MHEVLASPTALGLDPSSLLSRFGLIGLMLILFAETGLLLGFFLPGDTLLLSAGIATAIDPEKYPPLWLWLVLAPVAAIVGNLVGYWIGYRAGPHVFDKPDSKWFSPDYVEKSQRFFSRYGSWTIILARFVPIVRTVATTMAGVGRMNFGLFTLYSAIGGLLWTIPILLAGHELGRFQFVQDNKQYLDYVIVAVVLLSLLPTLVHYLRNRKRLKTSAGEGAGPAAASAPAAVDAGTDGR